MVSLPLDSAKLVGTRGLSLSTGGCGAVISIKSLAAPKVSEVESSSNLSTWHCPSGELLRAALNSPFSDTKVDGANACCLGSKCSFLGCAGASSAGHAAFGTGKHPLLHFLFLVWHGAVASACGGGEHQCRGSLALESFRCLSTLYGRTQCRVLEVCSRLSAESRFHKQLLEAEISLLLCPWVGSPGDFAPF